MEQKHQDRMFETHSGPYEVKMLYEGDNKSCMLSICFVQANIMTFEGEFANALMLSAQLRDSLGFECASELLDYWCVSPNSNLWDLNHSRPHERLAVMARDDDYHEPEYKPDDQYRFLGRTGWTDYEGGGSYYLYEHVTDMTLWVGGSTYLGCGNDPYVNEIEPITYSAWLAKVADYDEKEKQN